jgi:hypothetical protein
MEEWWSEGHLGSTMRTSRKCGREARDGAKVRSAGETLEDARKKRKTWPWLEGMGNLVQGSEDSVQGSEDSVQGSEDSVQGSEDSV